ncbi:MAG: hypothetical protein KAH24_01495, partial [Holophagae bacterium]|nr:hypothetical protein [Holophagae bacterium]
MKKIVFAGLLFLLVGGAFAGHEEAAVAKPWNGYWWPMIDGALITGKGYRGYPSTLGKYDARFELGGKATIWELEKHFKPDGESWYGHCNGWAAASVSEEEPTTTVNNEGYTFYVGDLKGLWTMYYQGATGPVYQGPGGESLDPFTFQTVLQTYLRDNEIPLLMDSDPTAEVWTWPIYSYTMDWTDDGDIRHVILNVLTSTDGVPPDAVNSNYESFDYTYDLTLSGGEPVSGEWTGNSVTDHPHFCWYPDEVLPENTAGNPYVEHDKVALLAESTYNNTMDDDNEPNDTFDDAVSMAGGFIGRILNDDWYGFNIEPEESFTLRLYCNSRTSGPTNHPFGAELFDDSGTWLEDMGYAIYPYPLTTFTGTDFITEFLKITPKANHFYDENYQFGVEMLSHVTVISHTTLENPFWENFVRAGFWPVTEDEIVRTDSEYRAVGVSEGAGFPLSTGTVNVTGPSFRDIPLTEGSGTPQWIKLNSMTDEYPAYSFYLSQGDGSMSFLKAAEPDTDLVLSHVPLNVAYWWYGLVLVNPSRFYPAAVDATLYGNDGAELAMTTISLNPYQKLVGLFDEFFPGVSQEDVSYIRFKSNEAITASALYGTLNHRELSYVPAVSESAWVAPAASSSPELSFFIPNDLLGYGEDGWNGLVFVAPDDEAVSVTLDLKWIMDDNTSVTNSLWIG